MDAKTKKQNLESAILFMQQEHANTLKGLHEEIANLQKRCSELTFKLAMENTHISQEDEFREKVEKLEQMLNVQKKSQQELICTLDKNQLEISSLKKKNSVQEAKHQVELQKVSQHLLAAQNEVDTKSDEIAQLRFKLRSYKVKLSQGQGDLHGVQARERTSVGSAGSMRSSKSSGSLSPTNEDSPRTPLPPPDTPPKFRRRGPLSLSGSKGAESMTALKNSNRKLSASSEKHDSIPDPTPFLQSSSSVVDSSLLKSSHFRSAESKMPLPPILPRGMSPGASRDYEHKKLAPQQTDSFKFVAHRGANRPHHDTTQSEVVMETLAVDEVTKRNHDLRRAHKYGSSEG